MYSSYIAQLTSYLGNITHIVCIHTPSPLLLIKVKYRDPVSLLNLIEMYNSTIAPHIPPFSRYLSWYLMESGENDDETKVARMDGWLVHPAPEVKVRPLLLGVVGV